MKNLTEKELFTIVENYNLMKLLIKQLLKLNTSTDEILKKLETKNFPEDDYLEVRKKIIKKIIEIDNKIPNLGHLK